jgi:hypothetical protein
MQSIEVQKISWDPRVGFAPLRVSLKSSLQNVQGNDQLFGCLWESWKVGDGAVSSEKSNCETAPSVETEFFVEYVYRDSGIINSHPRPS